MTSLAWPCSSVLARAQMLDTESVAHLKQFAQLRQVFILICIAYVCYLKYLVLSFKSFV